MPTTSCSQWRRPGNRMRRWRRRIWPLGMRCWICLIRLQSCAHRNSSLPRPLFESCTLDIRASLTNRLPRLVIDFAMEVGADLGRRTDASEPVVLHRCCWSDLSMLRERQMEPPMRCCPRRLLFHWTHGSPITFVPGQPTIFATSNSESHSRRSPRQRSSTLMLLCVLIASILGVDAVILK